MLKPASLAGLLLMIAGILGLWRIGVYCTSICLFALAGAAANALFARSE
jgi:hypothetical protein